MLSAATAAAHAKIIEAYSLYLPEVGFPDAVADPVRIGRRLQRMKRLNGTRLANRTRQMAERITFIREVDELQLTKRRSLESLILRLGMNHELQHEMPEIVTSHQGGLRIFQYPNQLAPYLQLLSGLSVQSYMEIGVRWGGNFMLTVEYLKRFNTVSRGVAIDLYESPLARHYCQRTPNMEFHQLNSQSSTFRRFLEGRTFDAIFIDGDHSYAGVKTDFLSVVGKARIYIFHDIVSTPCPGVAKFWSELKATEQYETHEFIEQYDEVIRRNHGKEYLGIGVAVTRNRAATKSPRPWMQDGPGGKWL